MHFSINQKQNYLYACLILLTIIISIAAYQITQQKWLLFREAENKFQERSYTEAIVLYKTSIERGWTTAIAYLHLADSYTAAGKFTEAIQNYQEYLKIYPQDSDVRLLLARSLSWNGNIEEAEKEYKKILKNSP